MTLTTINPSVFAIRIIFFIWLSISCCIAYSRDETITRNISNVIITEDHIDSRINSVYQYEMQLAGAEGQNRKRFIEYGGRFISLGEKENMCKSPYKTIDMISLIIRSKIRYSRELTQESYHDINSRQREIDRTQFENTIITDDDIVCFNESIHYKNDVVARLYRNDLESSSSIFARAVMKRVITLGNHNGLKLVADFPCSDLCPMYMFSIIRYDINEDQCIEYGGLRKMFRAGPFMTPKEYCIPKILKSMDNI